MLYNKLRFLKYLLLPLQIIYLIIIWIRNNLYHFNIIPKFYASPIIISIGNLNTGGTGKTPMTEYIIRLFKNRNVAILSRGYKRKTMGFITAQAHHSAQEIGDEMRQLYHKFKNTLIVCDQNRVNGVKKILEHNKEIDSIVLDDGFQYQKLNYDINIMLTDYNDLFIDDHLLPIGNLREPKNQSKRAHIIIITKCPHNISTISQKNIIDKIQPDINQKIYFSYIKEYNHIQMDPLQEITINKNEKHILITGIANTHTILEHMQETQIKYKHVKFIDHHNFKNKDIAKIISLKETLNMSDNLLLTEKDYYRLSLNHKKKLKNYFNLICIQIEFDFIENDKPNFNNELLNFRKS